MRACGCWGCRRLRIWLSARARRMRFHTPMCSPRPSASSLAWQRSFAASWPPWRHPRNDVMMRSPTVIAILAIALLAGQPASGLADERSAPQAMADRLLTAPLPGREPLDLAVRLRGVSAATPLIAPVPAVPLVAGYTDTFWILDQRTAQLFQAPATLRLVTDHAYWFVETDLADRVLPADLQRSASVFETRTYPLIHRYFGSEPKPSVDRDGHIVFLLANVPGVAAYFSSADAYPRAINPRSNEHEMIYVNLNALRPGQQAFDSTLV